MVVEHWMYVVKLESINEIVELIHKKIIKAKVEMPVIYFPLNVKKAAAETKQKNPKSGIRKTEK